MFGELTQDVRDLVDVTIRTRVNGERVSRARALVREAAALLAEEATPGPAGVHVNGEGRSWNWGNAVVGVRNAVAPPVRLDWQVDGSTRAALSLGAAYEGPPGCVHGGVSAMLLDHMMGETASAHHTRLTVTGTLTLRYVQPLALGRVRMAARISGESGRKVTVTGWIGADGADGPAVEASGLFIIPRWAHGPAAPAGVGSLD